VAAMMINFTLLIYDIVKNEKIQNTKKYTENSIKIIKASLVLAVIPLIFDGY